MGSRHTHPPSALYSLSLSGPRIGFFEVRFFTCYSMLSKSDLRLARLSDPVCFALVTVMTIDWLGNDSIDGVMERGMSFMLSPRRFD